MMYFRVEMVTVDTCNKVKCIKFILKETFISNVLYTGLLIGQ